jgi:hypothetical protein
MPERGTVTLADVAERAGVSLATASRALNGSTRKVRQESVDRVRAAALETGDEIEALRMAWTQGRIAAGLGRAFGRCRRVHVIDATFSIVTASPTALQLGQRLPHVDAYDPDRIAPVHFLSPTDTDGTAFFRHRATGFETVTEERGRAYFAQLNAEVRDVEPGPGYIADDSDLFDRIAVVEARYNRALLYRSRQLHSGAISADAVLAADPAVGRLTITAFLAIE